MRYVTWDLDSTLCDTRHRQSMLPGGANGPELATPFTPELALAYSQSCDEDAPIEPNLWLVRRFVVLGYGVGIVSARPRSVANKTVDWLHRHGVDYDFIELMSEFHDSNENFKLATLVRLRDAGYQIDCHFDDWPPVRLALAEVGIRCVIVTPELIDAPGTVS